MIKVTIKIKDGNYKAIRALGHAGYSKNGEPDIVCAGVSALIQTAVQGIMELSKCKDYILKSGDQLVIVDDDISEEHQRNANIIIQTVAMGISSIDCI